MGKWVHVLLEKDPEKMTGICKECGPIFLREKKGRLRCGVAVYEQDGHPRKTSNRRGKYRPTPVIVYAHKYKSENGETVKLTAEDRAKLFYESDKMCAICKIELDLSSARYDHCHSTGKFRGWLCNGCNSGLGFFKDSISALAEAQRYLTTHSN